MKTCTKCHIPAPEVGIGTNRYWCKKCRAKAARDSRKKPEVKSKSKSKLKLKRLSEITDTEKTCVDCREWKAHSEFHKSKRGRRGLSAYCKPCVKKRYYDADKSREASTRYRKNHPERRRSQQRLYQFKRRTQIEITSDKSVTDAFLKQLYAQTHCHYCKKPIQRKHRTADHKTPLSRNGAHTATNLTMACGTCNSKKRNLTEQEFKDKTE